MHRSIMTVLTTATLALVLAACTTTETTEADQPASDRTAEVDQVGTTAWLQDQDSRDYVRQVFKREIYPTRIECRPDGAGGMEVRFHTKRATQTTKPFHRWQFVLTEPGGIEAAVTAIPLRDRPDLQYRIISRDRAGNVGECAVAYR